MDLHLRTRNLKKGNFKGWEKRISNSDFKVGSRIIMKSEMEVGEH